MYSEENVIPLLLQIYRHIYDSLGEKDGFASVTLVTKIMLGVFGNVPALDKYFCKGFGFSKYFSEPLLREISDFMKPTKTNLIDIESRR